MYDGGADIFNQGRGGSVLYILFTYNLKRHPSDHSGYLPPSVPRGGFSITSIRKNIYVFLLSNDGVLYIPSGYSRGHKTILVCYDYSVLYYK